jgi:hypothetical protein
MPNEDPEDLQPLTPDERRRQDQRLRELLGPKLRTSEERARSASNLAKLQRLSAEIARTLAQPLRFGPVDFAPAPILPLGPQDLSGAIVVFWRFVAAPAHEQVWELERLHGLDSGKEASRG